jgi:two-component system sensor histidine kinase/response regulator
MNNINYKGKTKNELIKELQDLKQEFDSMKELFEKDIAERKQTEEELAQEQYLLHTLMDNLPDHIYFKDHASRFIRISEKLAQMFGLSDPSQAVGKTDFDFFTGEHAQQAYEDEQNIIRTGQTLSIEEKETHHDRPDTWVSTIKLPMRDKKGNIIGTFGISRDITESKQAEEELNQEQYLMRTLMDNLPDYIYFKNRESRFIRINKNHAQSFGLSNPSQAVGKTDFDFFTEEHARQAYEDEQNIIRTGQLLSLEEKETHHDRPDTWVSTIKMPMRDKEGNITGTFGISRDITDRKRAEEAFHKLSQRHEAILAAVPEIIVEVDKDKIYTWANPSGLKFFGDDVIGKEVSFYFEGEQDTYNKVQPLFEGIEDVFYVESWQRRYDGEKRLLAWWCRTLKDIEGNVTGALSSARDITERNRAEEEIKQKNEQLQTINAEKDKFFSILAHDLKSPLSAFLGATQILTEEIQNMTLEKIKEIAISMKESASNIFGLLENLLEWSRLKRGMMGFTPETFNMKQIITASIGVLTESARKKEITIDYSLPEDIIINADLHMFETVIRNLVSNSIKFTPKYGAIIISATITEDNNTEVKISDTGIGMDKELISRLFLLNEKTSRKGTEGEPSTGLGLLLCNEFIEKHRGKIWVESESGKGSTFCFIIPGKV